MNTRHRGRYIGFLALSALVLVAACTPRSAETVSLRSSGVVTWRPEQPGRVAVIVLGPTDMMHQDWFEFEPAVRKWLARAPTLTTSKKKRWVRKRYSMGGAFRRQFTETSSTMSSCAPDPFCLALATAWHPVGALLRSAIGEWRYLQPTPVVRPLNVADSIGATLPVELIEKDRLANAIGETVARLGRERTDHEFTLVPFEDVGNLSSTSQRSDAALTIRVASVGLISTDDRDPSVRLEIHLWTNLNRTGFQPWKHVSEPRKVSVWKAEDANLFREELENAIRTIAIQIVDGSFPAE